MERIKLTKADVNKAFDEAMNPVERPNAVGSLLERVKGKLPRLPKQPGMPKV